MPGAAASLFIVSFGERAADAACGSFVPMSSDSNGLDVAAPVAGSLSEAETAPHKPAESGAADWANAWKAVDESKSSGGVNGLAPAAVKETSDGEGASEPSALPVHDGHDQGLSSGVPESERDDALAPSAFPTAAYTDGDAAISPGASPTATPGYGAATTSPVVYPTAHPTTVPSYGGAAISPSPVPAAVPGVAPEEQVTPTSSTSAMPQPRSSTSAAWAENASPTTSLRQCAPPPASWGLKLVGDEAEVRRGYYDEGNIIAVRCLPGFAAADALSGHSTWSLRCSAATWRLEFQPSTRQGWMQANETCEPLPCSAPEDPHGVWRRPGLNDTLLLVCDSGYAADVNLGVFDCPRPGMPSPDVPRCVPSERWMNGDGTDSSAGTQAFLIILLIAVLALGALFLRGIDSDSGSCCPRRYRRHAPESDLLVEREEEAAEVAVDDME